MFCSPGREGEAGTPVGRRQHDMRRVHLAERRRNNTATAFQNKPHPRATSVPCRGMHVAMDAMLDTSQD